jgi:5-methyltetrahydrofolate--homocysteine methyltransferase
MEKEKHPLFGQNFEQQYHNVAIWSLTIPSGAPKNLRILSIVVSKLKLGNVQMKIFLGNLVISTDNAALQDRPEALNGLGTDCANNVLTRAMANDLVRITVLREALISGPVVSTKQTDLVREVVNVEPLTFSIMQHQPQIVCLSALLTVTMTAMKTTIDAIKEAGLRRGVKVLVGGAPLNERYATEIGADGYGATATDAVALARRQVGLAN